MNRYDHILFPVHQFKKNVVDHVPELKPYPEFANYPGDNADKVIRYVCFLYDKNTHLVKEFRDLKQRKEVALGDAGFKRNEDGSWSNEAIRLMDLSDEPARKMILKMMELNNHVAFNMIIYTEQMFLEYQELLMRPVIETPEGKKQKSLSVSALKSVYNTADYKKKLREECMAMKHDLDTLYKEVFGDHNDVREKHFFVHTPEHVANLKIVA